jgi:Family of unknown function (DUF6529)
VPEDERTARRLGLLQPRTRLTDRGLELEHHPSLVPSAVSRLPLRRGYDSIAPWQSSPPRHPKQRSYRWVAAPLVAFALGSLTAGLFAAHDPRSKGYFRLFFDDTLHFKAAFASAAAVLACFQLLTAAWIFRRLPWDKPAW